MVVDTATGNIAQQLTYDAFGRVLSDSNPGFQPFGFAGGLYDKETGLVRFGARDYDAYAGRWISKDPLQFNGRGNNLYEYVNGNPVEFVDYDGLMKIRAHRSRAGGNGVHYRYNFSFSPIANPNTYAAKTVAVANRLANFVNFIQPSAAGPNISSISGYLQCGALDHKLKNEFANMTGAGTNDLVTKEEALEYLNLMQLKYPVEYDSFYPAPEAFLQEAVERGSDNWFNLINSGDY
ncbi:RHS repeat-associated core domain-containing protein [Pseudoalteromonas sp. T1lg22]|uniref:RHS repeat-associated core domain-containing protein n=1 Tax=Pseudoalteromonas sp. T1lg22 TaxID=2077096 RepID=UPI000CF6264F|nr:RHS repeat-associated core domain-containing protein [Pseudoalteromonas sp. T1lg22]